MNSQSLPIILISESLFRKISHFYSNSACMCSLLKDAPEPCVLSMNDTLPTMFTNFSSCFSVTNSESSREASFSKYAFFDASIFALVLRCLHPMSVTCGEADSVLILTTSYIQLCSSSIRRRLASRSKKILTNICLYVYSMFMNMSSQLTKLKCLRCGHTWIPRQQKEPKTCPKCRSPYWNKHRKEQEDYVQYLLVVDSIHRVVHDTFYLLAGLHDAYFKLPLVGIGKPTSYPKLLLRLRIIELACQYLELVASYSIACRETGLLYPQMVLSVDTLEIKDFWDHVAHLADDDIRMIFNPNHALTGAEIADIRQRYDRIIAFRSRYWSLYNAIKHGMRVYPLEIEAKPELQQPGALYASLQWVHVIQDKKKRIQSKAKQWDGTEVQVSIQKQQIRDDLFPVDDLSEYKTIVDDCRLIINRIIQNNAPPWWTGHQTS